MIRDPIGSIYINYRNHIRLSNLQYTIINIRCTGIQGGWTGGGLWWVGLSIVYKNNYHVANEAYDCTKSPRCVQMMLQKCMFLLLNGGPAFAYKNPDRTQPHSLTWLPWWQTKSAEIDVKQICNQSDSSKRTLFGIELNFALAFKFRTSELALQTLDVIFHSFRSLKSENTSRFPYKTEELLVSNIVVELCHSNWTPVSNIIPTKIGHRCCTSMVQNIFNNAKQKLISHLK